MHFDYQTDGRIGKRAALGLIVLQPDQTIEHDFRRMLPLEGVSLYVSRVPSGTEVTQDTLSTMQETLPAAAGLFPRGVDLDVVGYGCTSGTSVIGAARIAALIREGCTTATVTEPVSALIAACGHLGATRLGFLSPYIAEVSGALRTTLAEAGIACPVFGSFDEAEEAKVAVIDGPSIVAAACGLAEQGGVDALFLSCTNLRTLDVIAEIEQVTGLPVLSSNQVLAWHMAQVAGIDATPFGRLMRG